MFKNNTKDISLDEKTGIDNASFSKNSNNKKITIVITQIWKVELLFHLVGKNKTKQIADRNSEFISKLKNWLETVILRSSPLILKNCKYLFFVIANFHETFQSVNDWVRENRIQTGTKSASVSPNITNQPKHT